MENNVDYIFVLAGSCPAHQQEKGIIFDPRGLFLTQINLENLELKQKETKILKLIFGFITYLGLL